MKVVFAFFCRNLYDSGDYCCDLQALQRSDLFNQRLIEDIGDDIKLLKSTAANNSTILPSRDVVSLLQSERVYLKLGCFFLSRCLDVQDFFCDLYMLGCYMEGFAC